MQATIIDSANTQFANESKQSTASVRALQNAFLSELPGLALAVITLIYVVSALVRL
jgi:hypothetical protein